MPVVRHGPSQTPSFQGGQILNAKELRAHAGARGPEDHTRVQKHLEIASLLENDTIPPPSVRRTMAPAVADAMVGAFAEQNSAEAPLGSARLPGARRDPPWLLRSSVRLGWRRVPSRTWRG